MNSFKNAIWWTKEDRKLLFLRISLRGIVIYLDGNTMVEAYDENQPSENWGDHISFMNPIIINDKGKEILNILETVFGIKPFYNNKLVLFGFDIETRRI